MATKNQIAYAEYLLKKDAHAENVRSNLAREAIQLGTLNEQKRTNIANEAIKSSTLDESVRHNLMSEQLTSSSLQEQKRHNLAGEAHNVSLLEEQTRHNLASESQAIDMLAETQRHNIASENLTFGHNTRMEMIDTAKLQNEQKLTDSRIELNKTQGELNTAKMNSLGFGAQGIVNAGKETINMWTDAVKDHVESVTGLNPETTPMSEVKSAYRDKITPYVEKAGKFLGFDDVNAFIGGLLPTTKLREQWASLTKINMY